MIGGFVFAHKFYLDIMPFGVPYIQNDNVLLIISWKGIFVASDSAFKNSNTEGLSVNFISYHLY